MATKSKLLMRRETEVLKLEIQSREIERDPGTSYEIRGGRIYKVAGVFKTVYAENKNEFQERSLDLSTREVLIILSNGPGETGVGYGGDEGGGWGRKLDCTAQGSMKTRS